MSYTRLAPRGVCAALLLLGLLSGCGGGGSTTPVNTGPVTSTPRTASGLQFTLTADKSVYKVGEAVNFTLAVKNVGTQPVEYSANPPLIADAIVTQNGQTVWHYSPTGSGGLGAISSAMAQPGTTITSFPFTWSTYSPGRYTLNSWFNPSNLNGINLSSQEAQASLYATPIQITITAP